MNPLVNVRHQKGAGWTLIELMVGLAVTAILTTLSYPSVRSAVLRIHRGDVLATLADVQLQQQRFRSNRPSFATLAELGIAATTSNGRYRLLEQAAPTATRFLVLASAHGAQTADLPCTHLLLEVSGAQTRLASGPDADVANDEPANQRCWGH